MKVGSNVKPTTKFNIEERENGKVAVIFFNNLEEIVKYDEKTYKYDMYVLELQKQDNLEQRIKSNYEIWLEFARNTEIEKLSSEIRKQRDELLNSTDWTQCADTALSQEAQESYREYRQQLRDITDQEEFPYNVRFPEKPQT